VITKENEPIIALRDGGYVIQHGEYRYVVRDTDASGIYKIADIKAYLADRPEALITEPTPPAPTQEELEAMARNARDSALRDIVDRYNAPRWEAMNEVERQVIRDYRQALLDWPESAGFPDVSTLPVLPNA